MKMQKEANTKDVSKEKKEIFIHEKKKCLVYSLSL